MSPTPHPYDPDCACCVRPEEGRRLASQREDLIAQGVDPADLLVPKFIDERVSKHVKEGLAAAGGFCAPEDVVYDAARLNDNAFTHIGFPEISVSRVTPKWFEPPTPAEARANSAYASLVTRIVDRQMQARNAAIDDACRVALREGWDVHVHEPPQPFNMYRRSNDDALYALGFVGIAFAPAKHILPTVHYHQEHLDEFDWDDDE